MLNKLKAFILCCFFITGCASYDTSTPPGEPLKESKILTLEEVKQKMPEFEGTNIGIAVGDPEFKTECGGYVSQGNNRFLYLPVYAKNFSEQVLSVNPNDFNLQNVANDVINCDSCMYSLENYFNHTNLPPNGQVQGWLVFYVEKGFRYTLNFNSMNGQGLVKKEVAI